MTPSHVGVASKNSGHSELVNRDFDWDLSILFWVFFLFKLELWPTHLYRFGMWVYNIIAVHKNVTMQTPIYFLRVEKPLGMVTCSLAPELGSWTPVSSLTGFCSELQVSFDYRVIPCLKNIVGKIICSSCS